MEHVACASPAWLFSRTTVIRRTAWLRDDEALTSVACVERRPLASSTMASNSSALSTYGSSAPCETHKHNTQTAA